MKLFVTGATGKIGSRLVPYLLKQGHDVRIFVRSADRALPLEEQGAEVIVGDLLENENLAESIQGVDAVIHTAAQFREQISEEDARKINVDATVALAEAALEVGVTRFVFTSTSNVYRNLEVDRPCREDDTLIPAKEIYPKTKIEAEEALLDLHRKGLDVRIMRLGFVYGDGDPHVEEVLPYMISLSPLKQLSTVHHDDVCQALMLAASTSDIANRIFNVADNSPITLSEFYKINDGPEQVPTEDGWLMPNIWELTLDTELLKKELNFQPKYPSMYTAKDMDAM